MIEQTPTKYVDFILDENKLIFVKVKMDYLKQMYAVDKEIFFQDNAQYEKKPHLGILVMNNRYQYVIPLTSAKHKHIHWKNITKSNYLIFEIRPIRSLTPNCISKTVNETNAKILLSILEIKKMFPIKSGVYEYINFSQIEDLKYRDLLQREFRLCKKAKRLFYRLLASSFFIFYLYSGPYTAHAL